MPTTAISATDLTPRVRRSEDCARSPQSEAATEIALALMGIGNLPDALFAETASWERSDAPCAVGHAAIRNGLATQSAPESLYVDQVVTHGRAATVSGRLTRDGTGTMMFCHVLRFTDSSCHTLAQIVSFERPDRV
nr:hypothetical protein [uncultured Celeribacter sp.]